MYSTVSVITSDFSHFQQYIDVLLYILYVQRLGVYPIGEQLVI